MGPHIRILPLAPLVLLLFAGSCGSSAATTSAACAVSCVDASPAPPVRDAAPAMPAADAAMPKGDAGCAACDDASTHVVPDAGDSGTVVAGGGSARVVAYINCLCGFGASTSASECLASPDPTMNQVKAWEDAGESPITHYILSFLSFQGSAIQTDPGEIWASGGGSTTDFTLEANLKAALQSAQAHGKKIMLSLGGAVGSSNFLSWWSSLGAASTDRVPAMTAQLNAVAQSFTQANGIQVDGFDVDIELGGVYQYGSNNYEATKELITAVPDALLVAFVPQVGNGLCAAPVVGDPLTPPDVLGGQCQQPVNGDDSAWVLARLDTECTKADGSPKLDYWGIQYYNAGQAACCGGGVDDPSMITSAYQHYKNFANGWPASGDTTSPSNPWYPWAYYPGPWPAFGGVGADRLVLGKPGCQGCAGSDYLDMPSMQTLIGQLDGKLAKPMGGLLFWDLCRLFGNSGSQCVSGTCQPSWGGDDVLANLTTLQQAMAGLHTQ